MKKFFISVAAVLATTLAVNAQLVSVESTNKLDGINAEEAIISPDGSFVVYTTFGGLNKVDLASRQVSEIAPGEGLYNLVVSPDGSKVAYSRPSFSDEKLRYVSLEAADLMSGAAEVIVKPTRNLNGGVAFAGNTINAVENGKAKAKSLDGKKAVSAPLASINYGHLDVTVDGKTTTIDPQGRGSYLWPSISPDGTRVCYWLVGEGCFTCDLDGSDVKSHGALRAARWLGNDMLVGMDEVDGGGYVPESSYIVVLDVATNDVQAITGDEVIAQYPTASDDGKHISFIGDGSEVYIINLK